jgi:rSAM/selenodomain-associated transferase 2/rSAM/selenodomain-associated transferase 1
LSERVVDRRLIIMTRIPEPGRVKTRLIPVLGPEGAAALHAALLDRTLRMASDHAQQTVVDVEVRFTGSLEAVDRFRPGRAGLWREQLGTDLGDRIHSAVQAACDEGAKAVVVIGTDCPDLTPEILHSAWQALRTSDLVLGPAEDGGYYLIGLRQPDPRLFAGIDWGTEHVREQTLARCRERSVTVSLLSGLGDVDEAEDLIRCRRHRQGFETGLPVTVPGLLSVIIPTWNEAHQLASTVTPILQHRDCEVVIADGGSTDGTVELATQLECRVVSANRGRGKQMNAGAALSRGDTLLFLHADTRLPTHFREEIRSTLEAGAVAGAFRFQVDLPGWGMRCVEWGTHLRARCLQRPYGDQGFFLRAADFFEVGGYRNWPLMEDFELCSRLRKRGRIRIAPSAAVTSGRRWKRLGAFRNTAINQCCIALYRLGVSVERIAQFYAKVR